LKIVNRSSNTNAWPKN